MKEEEPNILIQYISTTDIFTLYKKLNLFLFTRYFPLHRLSEETTTGKECSQIIDWSELVNAAEAAEKRLGKKTTLHFLLC